MTICGICHLDHAGECDRVPSDRSTDPAARPASQTPRAASVRELAIATAVQDVRPPEVIVAPGRGVRRRQILEDLAYLEDAWAPVVLGALPGSRPPRGVQRPLSPVERAMRLARALEEREQDRARGARLGIPPTGPIPSPENVGVLDLLALFVSTASDVAEAVTQWAGVERREPPTSSWVDPRPYLVTIRHWLEAAVEAEPTAEAFIVEQLHHLADRVAGHLGEVYDGQVLDAICPWCGGRTEEQPIGGVQTLVVFDRHTRSEQATGRPDDADRDPGPLIVCKGLNCTPPASAVGAPDSAERQRAGGRPAWPMREWDWLAKQLVAAGAVSSA